MPPLWGSFFTALLASTNAAVLPADIPALQNKQAVALRIMPIGASITAGYSAGVLTNGYRKPLRDTLVAEGWEVDMVGSQSNGDMTDNQHEGYPGIRTQSLATQTNSKQPLQKYKPNLLLLNVGTNDCSALISASDALKAYTNMVDAILNPDFGDNQFLIISTLLPRAAPTAAEKQCTWDFNEMVRNLVVTHPRSDRLALADMNTGYITAADLADDVHPSAEGYAKMAEVWFAAFKGVQDRISAPV